MKQHITVEQLNELGENGKESLRSWWKPEEGDYFACYCGCCSSEGTEHLLHEDNDEGGWVGNNYSHRWNETKKPFPLLSIGEMIYFLRQWNGDRDGLLIEGWETKNLGAEDDPWTVKPFYKRSTLEYFDGHELCDALWEAIKKCLEDKI